MDMDDLRDEFDAFRRDRSDGGRLVPLRGGGEIHLPAPREERSSDARAPLRESTDAEGLGAGEVAVSPPEEAGPQEDGDGGEVGASEEEGVVVFRPGMTMEEMEREAIVAALHEVDGNRRKAAEMLGIGERTLYRKIKRFDL